MHVCSNCLVTNFLCVYMIFLLNPLSGSSSSGTFVVLDAMFFFMNSKRLTFIYGYLQKHLKKQISLELQKSFSTKNAVLKFDDDDDIKIRICCMTAFGVTLLQVAINNHISPYSLQQ